MIDTLVFRLHSIAEKYPIFVALYQAAKSGRTIVGATYDKAEDVPLYQGKVSMQKFRLDHTNASAIPIKHYDTLDLPSSNHELAYCIDVGGDFIEVNVSLPKYLYGNNVLELITPPHHKNFTVNGRSPYAHVTYAFQQLKRLVPRILVDIASGNYVGGDSLGDRINFCDVEIVRLDMPINQIFKDRAEAMRYIQYQKRVLKKFERVERSNKTQYDGSFAYKTKRYYVKVYHKGDEFRKNQVKEIIRINQERRKENKGMFSNNIEYGAKHIDALQEYADRIVRYEFEFRGTYMSYLFNHRINKHWSKKFQRMKKLFKQLTREDDGLFFLKHYEKRYVDIFGCEHKKPIAEEAVKEIKFYYRKWDKVADTVELTEFTRDQYQAKLSLSRWGYHSFAEVQGWIKSMTRELNQVRKFNLNQPGPDHYTGRMLNGLEEVIEIPAQAITPKDIEFKVPLFKLMLDEVKKFFNNFQLENKTSEDELHDMIDNYNQSLNSKIAVLGDNPDKPTTPEGKRIAKSKVGQETRTYLLAFHRSVGQPMQDVIKKRLMSRSTYYKMQAAYKRITGSTANIGAAYFGSVNRNFDEIYTELINELLYGPFGGFYDAAYKKFYVV